MSPHLTTHDTGYPASLTEGWGLFYTQDYVSSRLQALKESPHASLAQEDPAFPQEPRIVTTRAEPILQGQPRSGRYKPVPKTDKPCAYCHSMFLGNNQETLCSDACRLQQRSIARSARQRARRAASKAFSTTPWNGPPL